jgi:hypothetical protein
MLNASSTFSTGMNLSFCFASSDTSTRSFSLSLGMITVEMPARMAAKLFSFRPPNAFRHRGVRLQRTLFARSHPRLRRSPNSNRLC